MRSYATRGETMETILFSELTGELRTAMQGKRWLLLTADELPQAGAALVFSELEDVLVAVDHRGAPIVEGLWMRAVHLLLISEQSDVESLKTSSGITKVIATDKAMKEHLW